MSAWPPRVRIDKRIPHGGGLGGGSADAAAVLRWAGVTDPETAVELGADVPFCLRGGRARVRGIGEVVEPLPFEARVVTLVVPPLHVSTAAVYRAWDDLDGPEGDAGNDLEPAALTVEPRLRDWRDLVGEAAGERPVLAGSGAAWFVLGERDNALAHLRGEGAAVIVARTVPGRRSIRGFRAPLWCGKPSDAVKPSGDGVRYFLRWWRVRRSIFLCFFLRIRLRRFLISEPMRSATLPATVIDAMVASRFRGRSIGRTTDFGSVNRGSIPLPGAREEVPVSVSAIVLAAGEGTRMRSRRPKPLHLICGRAMVLHVIHALEQVRPQRTALVVGHGAEQVTKKVQELAPAWANVVFVEQPTPRWNG